MPIATAAEGASVRVFTFKRGLLSGIAHDLELALERFRIDWTLEHVTATFDLTSLRVLHAVLAGQPAPTALSARDRQKIERTIASDVLHTSKHPEARFASSAVSADGDDFVVRGTLALASARKELSVHVHREKAAYAAELTVDQPSFGIVPYRALMGALELEPDVHVRVRVPAP